MLNFTTMQHMGVFTNGVLHNFNIISVDQQGSKLWDSMQSLSHGLLNEMWVDLAPPPSATPRGSSDTGQSGGNQVSASSRGPLTGLVPSVYLRERPFPTRSRDSLHTHHAKWDSLRTRQIQKGDVQARNLSKGGSAHRFNYWQLDATGVASQDYGNVNLLQRGIEGVEPGHPGNNPIFSGESMQRHGVRRYLQQSRFVPLRATDNDANVWIRVAARWLKKLHDWFSVAPFELSGSMSLSRLMPEIRIGERVREERDEGAMLYYCEGVENTYHYGSGGSTTLTLTRGHYEDEDLLDFVYAQYDRPRATSAREQCFIEESDVQAFVAGEPSRDLLDQFARGCTYRAPNTSGVGVSGGDPESTGLGEITDDYDAILREHRTLTAERDGTIPLQVDPDAPAAQDPGMNPTLDDTEPTVDGGALPAPGASEPDPGDPALSQEGLERGDPIATDEEFSVLDSTSDDPILGIEGTP